LHASGTTVDVVGFRTSLLQNGVLGRLAAATGGEVRAARDAAGSGGAAAVGGAIGAEIEKIRLQLEPILRQEL
jgi:hypothetical protein